MFKQEGSSYLKGGFSFPVANIYCDYLITHPHMHKWSAHSHKMDKRNEQTKRKTLLL